MKKFLFALLTGVMSLAFTAGVYAQMPKEKIELQGDEAFKAEILKADSDAIVSNALYVSASGSDTNEGTADKPFATVQKALDTVKSGQTIYVRSGIYNDLNVFKSSGTEGNYITLRNYPGEKPYLTFTGGTDGAILDLEGCDYIKIQGLEIGGHSAPQAFGILLNDDENHIIIKDNDIHNLLTTKPGENENGEANGILAIGFGETEEKSINNICIENNNVHNNTTGWCESVSTAGNCKYVNVINNTVHDNTNIGIDFYGNAGYCKVPALDQPRYCVAGGNTVYNSVCSYAECAGLYLDGARDTIFENNIIYGSMYGIEIGSEELQADYPVKNVIVRNNLVYGNSSGGIRVGGYDKTATGYVTATKIYNNTLSDNGEGDGGWNGEFCFVKCNGVDVRNNIVYKSSDKYPMIGGDLPAAYTLNVVFNNNVFYNPQGSDSIYFEYKGSSQEGMTAFNAVAGGTNYYGKPVFNSDYSLSEGSYGIDIGDNTVLNYMGNLVDLSNNYRAIGTIDAGAFEYQDGSKPTVTTGTTTTTEATTETTTYNKADVNKDGAIDNKDCVLMLKMVTGKMEISLENDINGDGKIDLKDVLSYLVNKVWNYTTGENTDDLFSVEANEYKNAVTFDYNGITLSKAIKMESSTVITFNAPNDGTLTIVADGEAGKKIKVNGTSYEIVPQGALEVNVTKGIVTIGKDTTNTYLYYMSFN